MGGEAFNTDVIVVQSGQEQRNRNWAGARAEYTASISTPVQRIADALQFVEDIRTFHLVIGGMADSFRFFDHLNCQAVGQALAATANPAVFQLQKTYSLAGRTYIRTITKPITASVKDYQGNALPNSVFVTVSGVTLVSVDHTTGLVTFSGAPSGTPTANFLYHIPVRFTSDKFDPEVEESNIAGGKPIIKWNSLGLIEVLPPNY